MAFIAELPPEWGWPRFEVADGRGWLPILAELHATLQHIDPGADVQRVGEKWGTLRVDAIASRPATVEAVRAAVRAAETASVRTCEVCGIPGELRTESRYQRTLCTTCAAVAAAARITPTALDLERLYKDHPGLDQ